MPPERQFISTLELEAPDSFHPAIRTQPLPKLHSRSPHTTRESEKLTTIDPTPFFRICAKQSICRRAILGLWQMKGLQPISRICGKQKVYK